MAATARYKVQSKDQHGITTYRKLTDEELVSLRSKLNEFTDQATKISPEEIEFKKGLIKWLKELIKKGMDRHIFRDFNAGSAYEKLQAGEATDFDIMFFFNIGRWTWEMEDDKDRPGFCTITHKHEKKDNSRSYRHLVDKNDRLSALKVRRWFTSRIDRVLNKHSPLKYEPSAKGKAANDADKTQETPVKGVEVKVSRKQKGPATTLLIEVEGHRPFTLDIVHAIHSKHMSENPYCDFVAKPFDKQNPNNEEYAHLWRKSYSRIEMKKLKSIDEGNKTHRKVLRIMKILGRHQPQLKFLPTYYYKNLILALSDQGESWTEEDLAQRFVDVIISLRNCLTDGKLPMYCNRRVNLLSWYTDREPLEHVAGYLRRIANKGLPGYVEMLGTETKSHQSVEMNLRDRRRRKRQNRAKRKSEKKTMMKSSAKYKKQQKRRRAALSKLVEKPGDWVPSPEKVNRTPFQNKSGVGTPQPQEEIPTR